jgi:hypothetical protein
LPSTVINNADVDSLISRLSRPLSVADREAFRAAARDALAHVPVHGEGSNYRAIKNLQRAYFDPPTRHRASWVISDDLARPNKLANLPPIEHSGDLRRVRKPAR